jgi:DNA-binding winged helix-turn-helix (wHTH) protein/tetratricopeptide (TPR) repeat protein
MPEGTRPAEEFYLGDWLVEPRLNRVSRAGVALHVRPQLVDLLVFLAGRPGEVVSKDEILGAVWPGQFIAESGLARCIAELREVFDDDAREPWVIQTIPKRGYRLVAPVEPLPSTGLAAGRTVGRSAADANRQPLPAAAPRTGPSPPAQDISGSGWSAGAAAPVLATPTPREAARDTSTGQPAPGETAEVAAGRRLVPRWLRTAFIAVALLVVVAVVEWRTKPAPALGDRDTILLGDFVNRTGDGVFDGTLKLALAVQLEQSPFLKLLPDEQIRSTFQFMRRPADTPLSGEVAREVCQRQGAKAVIGGSITPLGSRYAIGVEAIGCVDGEPLAREMVEAGSKDAVLKALGTAATGIRQKLGESLPSLRRFDVPVTEATTASLEALKAFSLAEEARLRDFPSGDRAIPLYERAIALDPQFALAYVHLGVMLRQTWGHQRGVDMFTRAYELRDRVSKAEGYEITTQYFTTMGERDKAQEIYLLWRQTYPRSWIPWYSLAHDYLQEGRFAEAAEGCRRALDLAPDRVSPTACLARAYMALGRYDEAEAVLADAIARGSTAPGLRDLRWMNAFARGDQVTMQREIDLAATSPDRGLSFLRNRAWAAAGRGRLRECRALLEEALDLARRVSVDTVAQVHMDQVFMEALAGNAGAISGPAQAALAASRAPELRGLLAVPLALGGRTDLARQALAGLAPAPDDLFQAIVVGSGAAAIELAEGRPRWALERLEPLRRFELGIYGQLIPISLRAEAYLAAGDAEAAARAFEQIVTHRGVHPMTPHGTLAWVGLARAHARAGRAADARTAYETFFKLWAEADPDVPVLVAARREYAVLVSR